MREISVIIPVYNKKNSHIINKIIILTRKPSETYFEYIKLIIERGGKECIIVKYYDLVFWPYRALNNFVEDFIINDI